MSSDSGFSGIRLIFIRGLIWSVIGLIYAPLFAGLHVVFQGVGLRQGAFVPAAALAGMVGAAFYGARQVALAGTLVGLAVASLVLFVVPGDVGFWQVTLSAAATGAVLGWLVRFPDRCSLQVPAKALAGLITGAACGALLALVEPLHPNNFHISGAVAFLVSVNGMLYVATLGWWVEQARISRRRACNLVESLVIAMLAATAAASLWAVAGPLIGAVDTRFSSLLDAMLNLMPMAMAGGVIAGAVTGALLQAFGFRWAHEG
jgi:hypothetical protein